MHGSNFSELALKRRVLVPDLNDGTSCDHIVLTISCNHYPLVISNLFVDL